MAVEFAQFFQRFGTQVTLIQRSPQLLKDFDPDAHDTLSVVLRREGMRVHTGTRLVNAGKCPGGKFVEFEHDGLVHRVEAEEIFNGLGRLAWAAVSDLIGRRAVFTAMFVVQAVVFYLIAGAHTYQSLLAMACLVLFCYGGGFGTMPAFAADHFGSRNVGKVYGLMLTAWGAGAAVGPMILSKVRDATGSYSVGLHAIAAIMLLASVLPLAVPNPRPRLVPAASRPDPRAGRGIRA